MFASSLGALPRGRNSLDMPVAALAGLAVAFIAFAAPADLLAQFVAATNISALIPAAEPPLGLKARLGLGGGGALAMFAFTLLVLRWLGRFGTRRAEEDEAVTELEAPRLRRRDFHPDAPARLPLQAVRELGEPELEPDQSEPEPEPCHDPEPMPFEPAPETAVDHQSPANEAAPADLEIEPAAEPSPAAEPESIEFEDAPVVPEPESWEHDHGDQDAGLPPENEESLDPSPAEPVQPEPERTLSAEANDAAAPPAGSIADLMERLEKGLARHRMIASAPAERPVAQATPSRPLTPDPADDRLQSAIESLQRFASRQD